MSEQQTDKCRWCGEPKQVGFPCVACWDRQTKEACGVSAPCGNPCGSAGRLESSPTGNTSDVIGHYDFHPAPGGYGWICPKCGKVYGPNTMECFGCNMLVPVTCAGGNAGGNGV